MLLLVWTRGCLLAMAALGILKSSLALLNMGTEIPRNYTEGERVELMVDKLTSFKTLLSLDYYALPLCSLDYNEISDLTSWTERFGDYWAGSRKSASPYRLNMKENVYCEHLCVSFLGPPERSGYTGNRVVQTIRHRYRHHWSIDHGLPAGSRMELGPSYFETLFTQGFPMGTTGRDDGLAYIYNHVTLHVYIQPVGDGAYKIARFIVQPSSIHHDFEKSMMEEDGDLKIRNPTFSCDPERVRSLDTDVIFEYDSRRRPQVASGKVLFTYDVIWTEARTMHWPWRWEVYLTNSYSTSDKVRVYSIVNNFIVLFVTLALMAAGLSRFLKKLVNTPEFVNTNDKVTTGAKETLDLHDWRAISGDIFRPPTFSPMILAVFCGTGAQLLSSVLCTVLLLYLGLLSVIQQGNLVVCVLLLYVLCGSINGYVTARLLMAFQCMDWSRAVALAGGFSGFIFLFLTILKGIAVSSYASITFSDLPVAILILLVPPGLAALVVLIGAYFGYQRGAFEFPMSPNSSPHFIPRQPWYSTRRCLGFVVGGVLPFSILYVELHFLMRTFWYENYYHTFGFLLCVIMIAITSNGVLTMSLTIFQLKKEDYSWWWNSFLVGGSVAFYVFIYSIFYFQRLQCTSILSIAIYFSYMGVISIGLFLMNGLVGVVATSLLINTFVFAVKRHNQ